MTVTAVTARSIGMRPSVRNTTWAASGPTTLTAHYFGVDIAMRVLEDLLRIWRSVQANDIDAKGYSDIMYNLGISPFSDDVYLLRGLHNRNAANGSTFANQASVSVLVPLGPNATVLNVVPNAAANLIAGAIRADSLVEQEFGKNLPWVPHSFWRPTGCPGAWMLSRLSDIDASDDVPVPPVFFKPHADYTKRPWLKVGSTDQSAAIDARIEYTGDGYVSYLQRVLNGAAGQNIGVDGIFGGGEGGQYANTTESAVKNVQRLFGYTVDGIVWTETWAAIHWIATANSIF